MYNTDAINGMILMFFCGITIGIIIGAYIIHKYIARNPYKVTMMTNTCYKCHKCNGYDECHLRNDNETKSKEPIVYDKNVRDFLDDQLVFESRLDKYMRETGKDIDGDVMDLYPIYYEYYILEGWSFRYFIDFLNKFDYSSMRHVKDSESEKIIIYTIHYFNLSRLLMYKEGL